MWPPPTSLWRGSTRIWRWLVGVARGAKIDVPVRVPALSNAVEIAVGTSALCARLGTGHVARVGDGYGNPTVVQRAVP